MVYCVLSRGLKGIEGHNILGAILGCIGSFFRALVWSNEFPSGPYRMIVSINRGPFNNVKGSFKRGLGDIRQL